VIFYAIDRMKELDRCAVPQFHITAAIAFRGTKSSDSRRLRRQWPKVVTTVELTSAAPE
jgi:hypothetical protein